VAAGADGEQFPAIPYAPDKVVNLYATGHGNKAIFNGSVQAVYGLIYRDVPGYPGIDLFGSLAQECAPVINGVFLTLTRITAGTFVDNHPMCGFPYELFHHFRGQKGVHTFDVFVYGYVGDIEILARKKRNQQFCNHRAYHRPFGSLCADPGDRPDFRQYGKPP
jgi:hypothetical protein